jgi:hypothetical protein
MFLSNSNFRRSISVLHPNNSNSGLGKTQNPGARAPGFFVGPLESLADQPRVRERIMKLS